MSKPKYPTSTLYYYFDKNIEKCDVWKKWEIYPNFFFSFWRRGYDFLYFYTRPHEQITDIIVEFLMWLMRFPNIKPLWKRHQRE